MNITLVVPTLNRPNHLLRLLRYYDSIGFSGNIIVGDSSDINTFNKVNLSLLKYLNRLSINHIFFPNLTPAAVMREVSHLITTDYVCCLPDDDFIVPKAIQSCIDFLAIKSEFAAAHGKGYVVHGVPNKPNKISFVPYKQAVVEESQSIDRVTNYLENYSVSLFSVMRTANWVKIFSKIPDSKIDPNCCDRAFIDELLPNVMLVASGKIKELDNIYLVRQDHDARYLLPNWFEWIVQPVWATTYMYFRKQVLDVIDSEVKFDVVSALKKFDQSFSIYLKKFMLQDHRSFLEFRLFINRKPFLKNLILKTKLTYTFFYDILNENRVHHEDLNAIIEIISEKKHELY